MVVWMSGELEIYLVVYGGGGVGWSIVKQLNKDASLLWDLFSMDDTVGVGIFWANSQSRA